MRPRSLGVEVQATSKEVQVRVTLAPYCFLYTSIKKYYFSYHLAERYETCIPRR